MQYTKDCTLFDTQCSILRTVQFDSQFDTLLIVQFDAQFTQTVRFDIESFIHS